MLLGAACIYFGRMRFKNPSQLTPEQYAELRAVTPDELLDIQVQNAAIDRALRERREALRVKRASGPTALLRALDVGAAVFIAGKSSPMLSATVRGVADRTGRQFQSRTERCLIEGTLRGTRITRVK